MCNKAYDYGVDVYFEVRANLIPIMTERKFISLPARATPATRPTGRPQIFEHLMGISVIRVSRMIPMIHV